VADTYWAIAKDAWRAERWLDKLRIWFKAPGWRPADVAARFAQPPFSTLAVRRYDTPLGTAKAVVAALQFVAVVFACAGFLWFADDVSLGLAALLTAAIAVALWALGALMQGRIGTLTMIGLDMAALAVAMLALG
jgi:hypothetical protein